MRADLDSRRGWATAALGFVAMFVSVGTGFSYGVLVLPAARDLGVAQGTVSGVFALTIMVFFLMGAPAGMLAERLGPRVVLLLGGLAMGGGLLLTATAHRPAALYVGHGLLVGVAMSTSFIPLTAVVSAHFERRRSLAVGIAVSGIGAGTLVLAPLIAALIRAFGWREAYAGLAVAATVVMVVCAALISTPSRRTTHRASAAQSMRTRDYRLMYLSQVLISVAIFTPFAHLPAFAEDSGVGPVEAAGLVGVVGAASILGRLALGPVADRRGVFGVYRACFAAIALSFVLWIWPGAGYGALVVHAAVLGVGYGGFVALLPALVSVRFGTSRLGSLLGVLYTSHVVGAGLGPLATGLLIQSSGYLPAGIAGLTSGTAAWLVLGMLSSSVSPPADQASPSRR